MVLLNSSGGAGVVFIIMWGLSGSFRGARGPEGVSAGRSRGPGGQGFNRLGGRLFCFENLFIMFFVFGLLLRGLLVFFALGRLEGSPRRPF